MENDTTIKIKGIENLKNYEECKRLKKENEDIKVMIAQLDNKPAPKASTKPFYYDKNVDYATMLKKLEKANLQLRVDLQYLNAINELDAVCEGVEVDQ